MSDPLFGEERTIKIVRGQDLSNEPVIINPAYQKEKLTVDEAIRTIARLALEVEAHGRVRSQG